MMRVGMRLLRSSNCMEAKLSTKAPNSVVVFPSKAFCSSWYALAEVSQFPILAWISSMQFFSIVRSATASASFHILIVLLSAAVGALSSTALGLGYSPITTSHTRKSLSGISIISRYFSIDLAHAGYVVGPSSLVARVGIFLLIDILGGGGRGACV